MAKNFGAAGNLIGPGACRQQGKTVTHGGTVPPKEKNVEQAYRFFPVRPHVGADHAA